MEVAISDDSGVSLSRLSRAYALHEATEVGNAQQLKELLQIGRGDSLSPFEATAADAERELILDIDDLDDSECSPLHIAILKGHYDAAATLLSYQADTKLTCEGSPPLHLAVCTGAIDKRKETAYRLVKLLLCCGAPAVQRDDNGQTAFHWAALLGLPKIMDALNSEFQIQAARDAETLRRAAQEAGMVIDSPPEVPNLHTMQDKQGNTALHMAAMSHSQEAVPFIAQMLGAKDAACMVNKAHQVPLHLAAAKGDARDADLIMCLNRDMCDAKDKHGRTPEDLARHLDLKGPESLLAGLDLDEAMSCGAFSAKKKQRQPTLLAAPPACREHRTAPEPIARGADVPPENVRRLHVLTDPEEGILRSSEFSGLQWDEQNRIAPLGDILKVHEWTYLRQIQRLCSALPDEPAAIGQLDPDTALSRGTWHAALAGVGACCHAIDCIMSRKVRNAFCAIRPPGHHAGPLGTVTSALDPHGSQGFCFLNNIAIAGAYAVNAYRHQGIRKVALLDFDVHHGNGTQACVGRVVPQVVQYPVATPLCEGGLRFQSFHPWLDEQDHKNILFASVQGFGKKPSLAGGYVYPGSGATCDTEPVPGQQNAATAQPQQGVSQPQSEEDRAFGEVPPEDPELEFQTVQGHHPPAGGPRIINVGIPGPGSEISMWRRAWRDKILPAVADFNPDLIIISAGFDAHKKDELNYRFIGVTERDYYWLTQQLVSLANAVCDGRIVSALEGGYRIQGGVVSAFARSVAAHVRALSEVNNQVWSYEESRVERATEIQRRMELIAVKKANALKAMERAAERRQAIAAALAASQQQAASQPASQLGTVSAANGVSAQPAQSMAQEGLSNSAVASPDIGGRKRRRAPVDYTALNLKLEEEKKRPKEGSDAGRGPLSNTVPLADPLITTAASAQPQAAVPDSVAINSSNLQQANE